ncbi:MAG: DUF255 domain-containing protein [Fimbriimonadales bacterium]|nr:DUF255 domain-containing protein [Fimbriimonadales bacterium]
MLIRKPNRLIDEKSPYLLQHAYNPVDWYPWGAEAFFKARVEDKPIFLSIGYASCHWCHVMERESFENQAIADLLNRYFVSVKVDREERPDVDEIYISAVQLMTGRAGWPLSVFLTPDGLPFYGGTYYPPQAFADILTRVASLWQTHREQALSAAVELKQELAQLTSMRHQSLRGERSPQIFRAYKAQLLEGFDPMYGGFGGAPKFPPSTALPVLLHLGAEWDDESCASMALITLFHMAQGGMFDHIGGGFHRYSTDERWFLPHFEKMLYDNAQLGWAYTHAYALTDEPFYADIATRTFDWMLREMRTAEGAFASALDADSPEGEGYYYTWTEQELYALLPRDEADLFCKVYEIQPEGNYHDEATRRPTGRNIPHLAQSLEEHAETLNLDPDELRERLADIRARLLIARQTRHAPRRDDKVLTDWNGLAIWALSYAADVLEEQGERYAQAATEAAEFLWQNLRDERGRLLHRYRDGEASIPAYLSDYAFFGMGLMELYSLTLERKWLERAVELADQMIERFHDAEYGGFYTTDSAHDWLILPLKSYQDRALPSGNGGAVQFLASLSTALAIDDPQRSERYAHLAGETLNSCWALLQRAPAAGDSLLYGYLLLEGDLMEPPDLEMPDDALALADEQEGPVRVDFLPQPEGLLVLFQIEDGWHINAGFEQAGRIPTTIEASTDLLLRIGKPLWTPPQTIQSGSEPIQVYYGQAAALLPVEAIETTEPADGFVRITVRYQPCTETECGLPVERVFVMPLSLRPQTE